MPQIVKLSASKGAPEIELAIGPTVIFAYTVEVFDAAGLFFEEFRGRFSRQPNFPRFSLANLPKVDGSSFLYAISGTTAAGPNRAFTAEARFFQQGKLQETLLLSQDNSDANGVFALSGDVEVDLV